MVDLTTPRITPTARAAGRVSSAGSQATQRLASAVQGTADTFTEHFEKEAAIQGDELLAEVQAEWNRSYNERAKTAGSGFAKNVLGDFDEFLAKRRAEYEASAVERGQANVPERNRQELDAAFNKYRLRLETKALQREAAVRAAAKARAVANTRRLKLNALISDPSMLPDYLETASTSGERSDYVRTALGMTVRDDPAAVRDQVLGGQWDADLTPSQKMSFIKLADSGIARQEREQEVETRAQQGMLEAELNEEIAFAAANGAPPVDSAFDETNLADLYASDPERGVEVRDNYKRAIDFAETLHGVSMSSPDGIQLEIERLERKVSEPGNTSEDVANLNTYTTALQARNTQIRNDPATYVQENQDGVQSIYGRLGEVDPENAPIVAENYVRGLEASYDRLGVPDELRAVLPKQDAAAQVAQFNAMGSDVAAQALAQYAETWGDAAPRVMAQLDKEGLAKEYSVAMRHMDNPGLSQAIVNLATVERADLVKGLPTASVTDTSRALTEGMTEYRTAFEFAGSGDAQEMMNKHFEVAEKFALDLVRRGADPEEAVERATTQLFPETPVLSNNEKYILPTGLSEFSTSIGAEALMDEDALRENGIQAINDPRFPDFADMEVTISSASRSGIWVNNSDGTGLQLMISLDGYLLPLNRADGSPYSFTFQEISAVGAAQPRQFTSFGPPPGAQK